MSNNLFVFDGGANAAPPFCLGEVADISDGLHVQIEAGAVRTVPLKRLASYTPTVGDRVLMVKISGTYVVLGKVV